MEIPRQEYWRGLPSSPGESSWPRDQTCISCLAGGFFTTEPPGKPPLFTIGNHLSLLTLLCYSQRIIKFCLSCTSYVTRKLTTYFILASGLYLRSEHIRNVCLVTGKHTGFFWCISEFVCMKLYFNYWVYAKNSNYVINTMITMQNCWTAHYCYCPIFKPQSLPAQLSRTTHEVSTRSL